MSQFLQTSAKLSGIFADISEKWRNNDVIKFCFK